MSQDVRAFTIFFSSEGTFVGENKIEAHMSCVFWCFTFFVDIFYTGHDSVEIHFGAGKAFGQTCSKGLCL